MLILITCYIVAAKNCMNKNVSVLPMSNITTNKKDSKKIESVSSIKTLDSSAADVGKNRGGKRQK